ncbi:MAG: hypothetical protein ABIF77_03895, partial [bacterium]
STTWIVSEGASILAQESIQQQIVAEVQAGLSKKSDYFVGEEPEPEPEVQEPEVEPGPGSVSESASSPRKSTRPRPAPRRRPRQKPGFWSCLKTWLNS